MQSSALGYDRQAKSFISGTLDVTALNYGVAVGRLWACDNNSRWLSNQVWSNYDFGTPSSLVLNDRFCNVSTDGGDYLDATYSTSKVPGAWNSLVFNNTYYNQGTDNKIFNNTADKIYAHYIANNASGIYYLKTILVENKHCQTHNLNWQTAKGNVRTLGISCEIQSTLFNINNTNQNMR